MREEILALAQEQLKVGGYDNLNFARIAETLSTTRANLHYHFKNKQQLALEATKVYVNEHYEEMRALQNAFPDNIVEFLNALEPHFIEHFSEAGGVSGCICTQLIRESDVPGPLRDLAVEHFSALNTMTVEMIISSMGRGVLKKNINPISLGMMISSLFMGVAQIALVQEDEEAFIEGFKGMFGRFIEPYRELK